MSTPATSPKISSVSVAYGSLRYQVMYISPSHMSYLHTIYTEPPKGRPMYFTLDRGNLIFWPKLSGDADVHIRYDSP